MVAGIHVFLTFRANKQLRSQTMGMRVANKVMATSLTGKGKRAWVSVADHGGMPSHKSPAEKGHVTECITV